MLFIFEVIALASDNDIATCLTGGSERPWVPYAKYEHRASKLIPTLAFRSQVMSDTHKCGPLLCVRTAVMSPILTGSKVHYINHVDCLGVTSFWQIKLNASRRTYILYVVPYYKQLRSKIIVFDTHRR